MAANRSAVVTWRGDLFKGEGTVSGVSSQAFEEMGLTWRARAEAAEGRTSPEELIAAAHASCFSMALANTLAERGHPPSQLEVRATVSFDPKQLRITTSHLEVRGQVPGLEEADFQEAAEQAKDGCPVSKALQGNVELEVEAELSGEEPPSWRPSPEEERPLPV